MKIHNTEMDIKTAGLLLFLADNADSEGIVKMGIREISRHIGESPMWVSRHINYLCGLNFIQSVPVHKEDTDNIPKAKVLKCYVNVDLIRIQAND